MRVRIVFKSLFGLVALAFVSFMGMSQITLPSFFSDHMVLKSDTQTRFWGWCKAGRTILIKASWLPDTLKAVSPGTSRWSVMLPTTAPGGPHEIVIISDPDTVKIADVMMGEVWLCSGQSNMQWSANNKLPQMLEALKGPFPEYVRLLNIRNIASSWPQEHLYDEWMRCDAASLQSFSAIGYFFAQKLNADLNVPVGVINASWGGTCGEVWLPAGDVLSDTLLAQKAVLQKETPRWPHLPGETWNAMIHPFVGYAISGALWYQGETNVVSWDGYQALLTRLIQSWRSNWNADFPFFFAQIAPYNYRNKEHQKAALLREAQTRVSLTVPKTGMVLTSDLVNDINNIHPLMKKEVALRFADLAMAEVYGHTGRNVQSPVYKDHSVVKNRVVISFHHMEGEKLRVNGDRVNELFIAGADRKFLPARYEFQGNQLVVFHPKVKAPVSVRYAFSDTALTNLYSTNGLPVNLFRLDDWDEPMEIAEP